MKLARESGTARIARITAEQEALGVTILKLNIGEPDFNTPEFIADAARRAIKEGKTRYTDVAGTPELRRAAAEKFQTENNICCSPDQVIIGTGAKQLIFNALMSTLQEGDEVVVATPSWVSYPDITTIAGAKPVIVNCGVETGFKITAPQLCKAISERTRWVILNSPCNPTGAVYSDLELQELAETLREFPKAAVMCDDIYEKIIFDGAKFSTMAQVAPDLTPRILTVNGVSKSHAMTGWRIGYATGPRELISAMIKLQGQSTTSASSISQFATLAALTETEKSKRFIGDCVVAYQRRRDYLINELSKIHGLACVVPQGAFYAFVSCRELCGSTTNRNERIENDLDFCEYLLRDFRVSTVPGTEFGGPGFIRLSFAVADEILAEACISIENAVAALQ